MHYYVSSVRHVNGIKMDRALLSLCLSKTFIIFCPTFTIARNHQWYVFAGSFARNRYLDLSFDWMAGNEDEDSTETPFTRKQPISRFRVTDLLKLPSGKIELITGCYRVWLKTRHPDLAARPYYFTADAIRSAPSSGDLPVVELMRK